MDDLQQPIETVTQLLECQDDEDENMSHLSYQEGPSPELNLSELLPLDKKEELN